MTQVGDVIRAHQVCDHRGIKLTRVHPFWGVVEQASASGTFFVRHLHGPKCKAAGTPTKPGGIWLASRMDEWTIPDPSEWPRQVCKAVALYRLGVTS